MRIVLCAIFFTFCSFSAFANPTIKDGYTDKLSYRAGDAVTFYLNASESGTIDLQIQDWNGQPVASILAVSVIQQQPKPLYWENGFGYTASAVWNVPHGLPSGLYKMNTSNPDFPIPIIIKYTVDPISDAPADIVVVIPTNTDEAYNTFTGQGTPYGAHSLYDENPATKTTHSVVSFQRPMQSFSHQRYDAFVKWMSSSYFKKNYRYVNVISDMDMDDWSEISDAKLLVIIGHSEYWTRQAKMNFDRFVDHGKDALVLSGNSMWWQVRYSADKTKLICFRGDHQPATYYTQQYNPEPAQSSDPYHECEPLLLTYNWTDPDLKSSALGSFGSDSPRGGFGIVNTGGREDQAGSGICDYGGFYGYKITALGSPLLKRHLPPYTSFSFPYATNANAGNTTAFPVLYLPGEEFDGTLVQKDPNNNWSVLPDKNGDPQLDLSALGLYRAELIGYDITQWDYSTGQTIPKPANYVPFMAFQRTKTSGRVVNVNSNYWCGDYGMGGVQYLGSAPCSGLNVNPNSDITDITDNMIYLMVNKQEIFSYPAPTEFRMKPSPYNVSYSICQSSGSINFTPDGVYLHDAGVDVPSSSAYKYDRSDGSASATVYDCSSCKHTKKMAFSHPNNDPASSLQIAPAAASASAGAGELGIYPNPSHGRFMINIEETGLTSEVHVYNSLGQVVYHSSVFNPQFSIDLYSQPKGIYFVKVQNSQKVYTEKVVVE